MGQGHFQSDGTGGDPTGTWLARAWQGDRVALGALLEQHLAGLRRYVRLRGGPQLWKRESVSDLVQSVCREVLQNAARIEYRGDEAFRAWLFTWALNKIRDRQRFWHAEKRDVGREVAGVGPNDHDVLACYQTLCTPSREAMLHEKIERIEAAFDALPASYREVITLSRIVGLSHAEIARRQGCQSGAVRSLLTPKQAPGASPAPARERPGGTV